MVYTIAEDGVRSNFDVLAKILAKHQRIRSAEEPQAEAAPPPEPKSKARAEGIDLDSWNTGGMGRSAWLLTAVDIKSVAIVIRIVLQLLQASGRQLRISSPKQLVLFVFASVFCIFATLMAAASTHQMIDR